jgi:hypothetical protein
MEDFTHAYCDTCSAIQPVIQESLTGPDTSGKFIGGDLLCNECRSIIATLYKRKAGLVAVEKERHPNGSYQFGGAGKSLP